MKRYWIQERLVAILLDTLKDPGVTNSMILPPNQFLRREMLGSLRMLSLIKEIRIEIFFFEEEYVDIPTAFIDIDQASIPNIVQEAYLNQSNIQEPPVPEEQTLPPPEPTPLRRSTRERRSAVLDDYIVFL